MEDRGAAHQAGLNWQKPNRRQPHGRQRHLCDAGGWHLGVPLDFGGDELTNLTDAMWTGESNRELLALGGVAWRCYQRGRVLV